MVDALNRRAGFDQQVFDKAAATEEDAEDAGLTPEQVAEAEAVYGLVCRLGEPDGAIHREDIVEAQGGDYKAPPRHAALPLLRHE